MNKPNYNSLYCQLRRAKKLDELMLFLEDPSFPGPGSYNRCVKAGSLLAGWGFAHSPSSIWRLYRRHLLLWRMGVAQSSAKYTENLVVTDEDIRRMTAQRTFEFLTNPDLDPKVLIHLARIELQKDVHRLNQKKFEAARRTPLDVALDAVDEEGKDRPQDARGAGRPAGAARPTKARGVCARSPGDGSQKADLTSPPSTHGRVYFTNSLQVGVDGEKVDFQRTQKRTEEVKSSQDALGEAGKEFGRNYGINGREGWGSSSVARLFPFQNFAAPEFYTQFLELRA